MRFDAAKLRTKARKLNEKEQEEMRFREENREWLAMSEKIALKLRYYLNQEDITQAELAKRMNVTPAQITKILSGKENLGLKTISKIEQAIGKSIIDIKFDDIDKNLGIEEPRTRQFGVTRGLD
jgi:DNA-binding MarR family transcriptional regulator